MEIRKIGIIMNGVTGRMGTNQHSEAFDQSDHGPRWH